MRRATVVVAIALAGTLTAGCGASDRSVDDGRVSVVAGFYPLQYVAERVGGDQVTVTSLAQPGAEPHDLELSPRQVASIVDADLVLHLGGFQPAVDETVRLEAADSSLDVGTTVPLLIAGEGTHSHEGEPEDGPAEEGSADPHLWLDPTRLATVADAVAQRLAIADPGHAGGYRQRAAAFRRELEALDGEFKAALAGCARREIVVSHEAFGYLAQRYGLEQVALSGVSPEAEPTPRRLAEVAREARDHGATTIFFESLVSPRVAEAIASETGAATAVLDPIEGPPASGDYLTAMRANLAALVPALGCPR
jgi:zinc transport system substrate-binding protein